VRTREKPTPVFWSWQPAFGVAALLIVVAASIALIRNIDRRRVQQLAQATQGDRTVVSGQWPVVGKSEPEDKEKTSAVAPERQSTRENKQPGGGLEEMKRKERPAPSEGGPGDEQKKEWNAKPMVIASVDRTTGNEPKELEMQNRVVGREVAAGAAGTSPAATAAAPKDGLDADRAAGSGTKVLALKKGSEAAADKPARSLGYTYAAGDACAPSETGRDALVSSGSKLEGHAPSRPDGKTAIPKMLVIREKGAWENVWLTQNRVQNTNQPLPPVDFKNQMAIAVPTSGNGTEYQVVRTEEKPDRIIVLYRENTAPRRREPLPPYQFNVVNSKPRVEFQRVE